MEIEQSALWDEILRVITSGQPPILRGFKAVLHGAERDIMVLKVISIDRVRDFAGKFTDEMTIEFIVQAGDFARYILSNQESVELTLLEYPLTAVGAIENINQPLTGERYRLVLPDIPNPLLANRMGPQPSTESLNVAATMTVSGQLINKSVEQLTMKTVGDTFRNCTIGDVLRAVMTKESMNLNVQDERQIKGVDMVPAINDQLKSQIVIDTPTRLVDVPAYLHHKCGGVYSSGMGYYLHQDYWHVYPLYDTTRFNTSARTLTIINVPPNRLPSIPTTYMVDGDSLVVIATGDRDFRDDSDQQQLNKGNGVIFANADKFMKDFIVRDGNKAIAARGTTVNEFAANQRTSGNNNLRAGINPITANPYLEMSALARREGSVAAFVWEHSVPELIFPGIPTMILYLDEDEVKQMFGTVLMAQDYISMAGEGMTDKRHITNTGLAVFVKRDSAA